LYWLTGISSRDGFHHVLVVFSSGIDGGDITRRWEVGEDIAMTQMRQDYIDAHPEIAENEFISEISILRYQAEQEAEDIIAELDENDNIAFDENDEKED